MGVSSLKHLEHQSVHVHKSDICHPYAPIESRQPKNSSFAFSAWIRRMDIKVHTPYVHSIRRMSVRRHTPYVLRNMGFGMFRPKRWVGRLGFRTECHILPPLKEFRPEINSSRREWKNLWKDMGTSVASGLHVPMWIHDLDASSIGP
jgi:hypothetical protein